MTTDTTAITEATTEALAPATGIQPEAEAAPAEPEPGAHGDKAAKEAARYRTQLRQAETERDALATRLSHLQHAEAERLSGLVKPAALWATGTTLDDLLDEGGNLDPDKVTAASQRACDELGATPTGLPKPDPSQGGGWGDAFGPRGSFTDAFRP